MSWVKVTNGKITVSVTSQAYKDIFGKDGFRIISDNNSNNPTHCDDQRKKAKNKSTVKSNTAKNTQKVEKVIEKDI